jgi:LmbE family N-acetylglucosaminyl deacetylase
LVSAANATARFAGVLPGMTATQAKSVAGSTQQSNWSWVEHDPQEDLEEIFSLAEQLMQFSPLVGVESIEKNLWAGRSILQPQSITMDITDTLEQKLEAIRCYKTQFPPSKAYIFDRVRGLAIAEGAAANCYAGETFISTRALRTRDLLQSVLG